MAKIKYPECGKIINTHGCRGAVKVEPWCDSPAMFTALPRVFVKKDGAMQALALKKASTNGRFVFAELQGVDSMEAADALRGTVLYADREDLGVPDGVLLLAEIIGLPVFHAESGERMGEVRDVIHPGASDIYVIATARGEVMVPDVPAFVKRVDEEGLFLTPIEGMFDDAI